MSSKKRKYELRIRAERQRETRERIVSATVGLHQERGPARTTIAEVARRAGVERLTIYNNFPTEGELFAACQGHYFAAHPPPDPAPAFALTDPAQRMHTVLSGLYPWYRECELMIGNSLRDRAALPALHALLSHTVDVQLATLGDALAASWSRRRHAQVRLRAAVAVALDFWTWQRLTSEGLDDEAAAQLMGDLVSCEANRGSPSGTG
jgi:AcrR family transcriptional regulator